MKYVWIILFSKALTTNVFEKLYNGKLKYGMYIMTHSNLQSACIKSVVNAGIISNLRVD